MATKSNIRSMLGKFVKYGLPTLLIAGLCYVLFLDINLGEM